MAPLPSKGADKVVCLDYSTFATRVFGQEPKRWRGDQGLSALPEAGSIDDIVGPR